MGVVRVVALMAQKDRSDKVPLQTLFSDFYANEGRRFVLWLPVCLGIGIWIYFSLMVEPEWHWGLLWLVPVVLLGMGPGGRLGWGALAVLWVCLAVGLGFGLAVLSARMASAPVIAHPLGETVEGRILGLSRSASGAPRLLLDRLTIYGVEPDRTPERVRLTVLDPVPEPLPVPGTRIRVYATLMPTGEPVEPGAFDFRRRAFFDRLGGTGLTRGVVLPVPAIEKSGVKDRLRVWLAERRDALSRGLRDALPGRQGAFAAAIIVGDRSDIQEADAEALRASNLAHLLAISGLHMGILTGLVFALARVLLTLHPIPAYHWPTKKIAAVLALSAGAAYLAFSGATIATQRAFIMVAVAFCAVLVDRPAITLRGLAIAAAIVLALRPISLLDAGFQMSFAATAALVAGFEAVRPLVRNRTSRSSGLLRVMARTVIFYIAALLFSSLLAGLATAPFAAYHFNRTAPYGLLANLLAVPLMGLWIAPWACLAAVLACFGLAEPALKAMGWGIEMVLKVAHWVAELPGAVQPIAAAPPIVLGLISMGGLWLLLWRSHWRFGGIGVVVAGLVAWSTAPPRADLLVGPEARLIGLMGPNGRALDHDKAQSFAAKSWLRRDGDAAAQEVAASRGNFARMKGGLSAALPDGWRLEARWSRNIEPEELSALCRPRTLLIAREGGPVEGPCRYVGKAELREKGAFSATVSENGLIVRTARDPAQKRLWSR